MHGRRLDETPEVLFTYTGPDEDIFVLIVRHKLSLMPFWFCHNEAIFRRQTPEEVRVELFNAVVDANDKIRPAGTLYAESIRLRKGAKGKDFLHIHLTADGAEMVKSTALGGTIVDMPVTRAKGANILRQMDEYAKAAIKAI
jgi:hypothetical protein